LVRLPKGGFDVTMVIKTYLIAISTAMRDDVGPARGYQAMLCQVLVQQGPKLYQFRLVGRKAVNLKNID
jgi:hypothetical protein